MPFSHGHREAPDDEIESIEYIKRVLTPSRNYYNVYTLFLDSGGYDACRRYSRPQGPQLTTPQVRLMFRHGTSCLRPTHHGRFLRDIVADLSVIQPRRKSQDVNAYMKVQSIVDGDRVAPDDS